MITVVSTTSDTAAAHRLNPTARLWRHIATALVGAVLLAGTAVGTDDWFPLGPFRMYTNKAGSSGVVRVIVIRAVDENGRDRRVYGGNVGLRHAEYEGQIRRFRDDPTLLAAVAEAYSSVQPDRPRLVSVRLEEHLRQVVDNVVEDDVETRVVAEWEA